MALAADGSAVSQVLTPRALANALRVLLAVGGSTNALAHWTAVAGRLGIQVDLALRHSRKAAASARPPPTVLVTMSFRFAFKR